LLLPVCFAGMEYVTRKDWEKIAIAFLFVTMAGVCFSVWQYFQNIHSVQAAYLRAQTINTPLNNDHVRFSLLVSLGILTSVFLLTEKHKKVTEALVGVLSVITLVFIVYLHVLAVRTGLICFYLGSIIFMIWFLRKVKNRLRYAWLLVFVILLPLVSWFAFPTFKNRISYLKYDLSTTWRDVYRSGSNDGNRLMAVRAGWQIQNWHPFMGVGFGDIKTETDKWYRAMHLQMSEGDKILPSSEWMMYGAGTGWIGFFLFSMIMVIPFFVNRLRKNIWWWLINIFIALSYLFDIGLEVQYGVFVHAFILLWWYKWLTVVSNTPNIDKVRENKSGEILKLN
ncbi:MAG TPA: O-antigen ligase family protein, partial [Chitinophagaceae bacterium]|nr:O-antigen ligase family protein [Chitinophagaceae bacterium]